jgi:uncharacterized protein YjdB
MILHRPIIVPLVVLLAACATSVAAPQAGCANTMQSALVLPSSATLSVGDILRLAVALPPVCAGAVPTPQWRWKSASAAVASVAPLTGLVTAVGAGTTAIDVSSTSDPAVTGAATVRVLP